MRISDWSSDVCSSDLGIRGGGRQLSADRSRTAAVANIVAGVDHGVRRRTAARRPVHLRLRPLAAQAFPRRHRTPHRSDPAGRLLLCAASGRSEEHTSELQSLMRISYAVFCLKKKNYNTLQTI